MRANPTATNTSDTIPNREMTGMRPSRQATAEFSNTSRLMNGKMIAVRLTAMKEIVKPRKPEIGPSSLVKANSPSQTSPRIAEIKMAQCGEW